MVPAVAVNVALLAAAATATDVGTVRNELLLDSATTVPPAAAAPLSPTVQIDFPKLFNVVGTQDREVTLDEAAPPATTPPVATIGTAIPKLEEPMLLIPIAVVIAPAAIVRFTTATVPFEIVPAFIPAATQV
jgi:hypothetical protein